MPGGASSIEEHVAIEVAPYTDEYVAGGQGAQSVAEVA